MEKGKVSKEIERVSLYSKRDPLYSLYVLPFIVVYLAWGFYFVMVDDLQYELLGLPITVVLHLLAFLSCQWSVEFNCWMAFSAANNIHQASHVKVVPMPSKGSKEMCPLVKVKTSDGIQIHFSYQKRKFIYDLQSKSFGKLQFPTHMTVDQYQTAAPIAKANMGNILTTFGENKFDIPLPSFSDLYKEQAVAPFFVFQVFCVALWCMDEYWYYSLFTLFMLLVFEATVVKSRLKNLEVLRSMGLPPQNIMALRDGKWTSIVSYQLVPGDIVALKQQDDFVAPCDMLILSGTCVVNEAMLTGESTPHTKESIAYRDGTDPISIKKDGLHVIFSGTKLIQQNPGDNSKLTYPCPSDSVICYVLRTGFHTTQGRLMRVILFSTERVTVNTKESFLFILFLLIFALAASGYVLNHGLADPNRSRYKLFLECVLIITSVVPPELPMELSMAVNTALLALHKLGIFCTEPFRVPFAGKIDVCCFDKTGTLTSDHLILRGVAGLRDDNTLVFPDDIPDETSYVLAGCHSLIFINSKVVGDPMETAALKAINWKLSTGDIVSGKNKTLRIAHRYHFTSELKRMSCVVKLEDNKGTTYAICKGAPEKVLEFLDPSQVPAHYSDTYKHWARKGARVIALAYKPLTSSMTSDVIRKLHREDVEKDMLFAGFVVFECPLKKDSASVIQRLKASSHKVCMITGDNNLTACQVAAELGMTTKPTLILDSESSKWISIDETESYAIDEFKSLMSKYDFCVSGSSFKLFVDKLRSSIPDVAVFSRVNPEQKESIIAIMNSLGNTTLMCGDGTNDVGGLKQAHVGVALMGTTTTETKPKSTTTSTTSTAAKPAPLRNRPQTGAATKGARPEPPKKLAELLEEMEETESTMVRLGDASIASPFSAKTASVSAVINIIRQGRCSLVTTHQMFKILALNCLISAYSLSVLYLDGVKMGDTQATMAGMTIAMCFLFISRSQPLKELSPKKPKSHIFNAYLMTSVLSQFAVHLMSLMYIVSSAKEYDERDGPVDLDAPFSPNVLNSAVFIISLSMQITTFAVNYKGHPFMQALSENKPLKNMLTAASVLAMLLASEFSAGLNEYFQLTPFPYLSGLSNTLLITMGLDFSLCYFLEKAASYLFDG